MMQSSTRLSTGMLCVGVMLALLPHAAVAYDVAVYSASPEVLALHATPRWTGTNEFDLSDPNYLLGLVGILSWFLALGFAVVGVGSSRFCCKGQRPTAGVEVLQRSPLWRLPLPPAQWWALLGAFLSLMGAVIMSLGDGRVSTGSTAVSTGVASMAVEFSDLGAHLIDGNPAFALGWASFDSLENVTCVTQIGSGYVTDMYSMFVNVEQSYLETQAYFAQVSADVDHLSTLIDTEPSPTVIWLLILTIFAALTAISTVILRSYALRSLTMNTPPSADLQKCGHVLNVLYPLLLLFVIGISFLLLGSTLSVTASLADYCVDPFSNSGKLGSLGQADSGVLEYYASCSGENPLASQRQLTKDYLTAAQAERSVLSDHVTLVCLNNTAAAAELDVAYMKGNFTTVQDVLTDTYYELETCDTINGLFTETILVSLCDTVFDGYIWRFMGLCILCVFSIVLLIAQHVMVYYYVPREIYMEGGRSDQMVQQAALLPQNPVPQQQPQQPQQQRQQPQPQPQRVEMKQVVSPTLEYPEPQYQPQPQYNDNRSLPPLDVFSGGKQAFPSLSQQHGRLPPLQGSSPLKDSERSWVVKSHQ